MEFFMPSKEVILNELTESYYLPLLDTFYS